ncbi:lamin tail domain-containing protein [Kaarinaea lacus]
MNLIRFYLSAVFMFLSTSVNATLIFSEYVEGSSYNKALEIFNTGNTVDFDSDGYAIEIYTNGSTSASYSLNLAGLLNSHATFVIGNNRASAGILSVANQLSGSLNFNGDDAITLVHNGVIVDRIGQIGMDPGAEWGTDLTSTQDNTLRRRADILLGDIDAAASFDPALQWTGFAQDSFDGLGQHLVSVSPMLENPPVSVPAPASLLLLLVGLLGLVLTRQPRPTLLKLI